MKRVTTRSHEEDGGWPVASLRRAEFELALVPRNALDAAHPHGHARRGDAMTPAIRHLAAQMLDEYADRLGNDGCNDWHFPASWTEEEWRAFTARYAEWNGAPVGALTNFAVAAFLAHLLRGEP